MPRSTQQKLDSVGDIASADLGLMEGKLQRPRTWSSLRSKSSSFTLSSTVAPSCIRTSSANNTDWQVEANRTNQSVKKTHLNPTWCRPWASRSSPWARARPWSTQGIPRRRYRMSTRRHPRSRESRRSRTRPSSPSRRRVASAEARLAAPRGAARARASRWDGGAAPPMECPGGSAATAMHCPQTASGCEGGQETAIPDPGHRARWGPWGTASARGAAEVECRVPFRPGRGSAGMTQTEALIQTESLKTHNCGLYHEK